MALCPSTSCHSSLASSILFSLGDGGGDYQMGEHGGGSARQNRNISVKRNYGGEAKHTRRKSVAFRKSMVSPHRRFHEQQMRQSCAMHACALNAQQYPSPISPTGIHAAWHTWGGEAAVAWYLERKTPAHAYQNRVCHCCRACKSGIQCAPSLQTGCPKGWARWSYSTLRYDRRGVTCYVEALGST